MTELPRFATLMTVKAPLLKGAPLTCALPLLETMSWSAMPPGASPLRPVRLLFVHWKNGAVASRFWPKDEKSFNPAVPLPPTLKPLRPTLRETLLVGQIKNLCQNLGEDENGAAGHKSAGRVLDRACPSMPEEPPGTSYPTHTKA